MKNGQGKWKKSAHIDSDRIVGNYKSDMKHGYGEFTWKTGSTFKGKYFEDKKQGFGEMIWADGSRYIGFWSKGVQ